MKVTDILYEAYLAALLAGERRECHVIVSELISKGITVRELYQSLFQRSMYDVGDKWEHDQISIAVEHMATVITESLMSLAYPMLFKKQHLDKRALITCVSGEFHQIGARMVADYFEMNGWHGHTLGANTPTFSLLQALKKIKPNILGISISYTFNFPVLEEMIKAVLNEFPEQQILVGGQAFITLCERNLNENLTLRYSNVRYVNSLDSLELIISEK